MVKRQQTKVRKSELHKLINWLVAKIKDQPEELLAHYELAFIYYFDKQYALMAKVLEKLIVQEPDSSLAHFLLVLAYGGLRQPKKLARAQKQALKKVAVSLDSQAPATAEKPVPKYRPRDLELEEFKAKYPGDPNLAEVKYYEKVVERGEFSYEQTFLLGLAYKRLGWYSAAAIAFQQVTKLKPAYDEAYFELGNTYKHLGKYQEAVKAYQQALQLKPDMAEVCFQLGLTWVKLNNTQEALVEYERLNPLNHHLAWQLLDEIRKIS